MPPSVRVLALFAHPDDAEFLCAGTLAHLADRGAAIHIASMTAGDCGSSILSSAKISRIRRAGSPTRRRPAQRTVHLPGERDLLVVFDRPTLRKVMELVRRVDPALVITHSPQDYMVDHETTSRLCQSACFGASAPNFRTGARRDLLPPSGPSRTSITLNPLATATSWAMRFSLGSSWILAPRLNGRNKCWLAMKASAPGFNFSKPFRRSTIRSVKWPRAPVNWRGFPWGEGFRQHLGQAFPGENLLTSLLDELVRAARTSGIYMDGQDRQDKKAE